MSDFFLNRGPRTVFFALKNDIHPSCAVDQVIDLLVKEPVQTLIKIERRCEEEILINAFTQSDLIKARVISPIFAIN